MISKGRLEERNAKPSRGRRLAPKRRSIMLLARCEGDTEVVYIRLLAQKHGIRNHETDVRKAGVPRTCVTEARDAAKPHRKSGMVLCVAALCDRDEHPKIEESLDIAKSNGIHFVFSNPAIELWFLLHFRDQTAHIERDKALRELQQQLPAYEKGELDLADLDGGLAHARRRAVALRKMHIANRNPARENPSTNMDQLLDEIEALAGLARGDE